MSRGPILIVVVTGVALAALFLTGGAGAAPDDTYTAAVAPTRVQPSVSAGYTITLHSQGSSDDTANNGEITIPSGFSVSAPTLSASSSGGGCGAVLWVASIDPVDSSKIDLIPALPGTGLCSGATLTVTFDATSAGAEGPHSWVTELFADATQFDINGEQPQTVVDGTPPPVPTIDPHANVVGTPTTSFTFSSLGATSFECHVDAAAFSPCSSGSPVGPFGDGLHTFYVRALDDVGNASEPASSEWTIDTVNPVVTLTDKPPLITNQSTGSFSFSSNKPNSTLECKLDGAEFSGCTSPQLYFGLDDGAHTFSVQATSLGNTGPATEYTWTVDTVAPDTTITSTPPAASNSASASFTFASSEVGSTFSCGLDAGGFAPCASPKNYAGLGDGAHTFRVQAVDAAGNVDTSPASYSWQIAGVGPATTDTTPPGNVKRLKRSVAYRVLKLAWTRPSDSDFDHVKVFVSTSAKSPPRTLVYRGKGRAYTNKRFKNGLYYRYAVVSYDRIGNASRGAAVVVLPSVLLRSPRNGAVVKSPPRLLWAPVPKATFYNVQLYSTTAKMLSAWPGKAKLTLSRRWSYNGRRFELRKGLYRWFVWPGFGPRAKGRYGQLLGQGTFRVS
jgi:hypothetical protein